MTPAEAILLLDRTTKRLESGGYNVVAALAPIESVAGAHVSIAVDTIACDLDATLLALMKEITAAWSRKNRERRSLAV